MSEDNSAGNSSSEDEAPSKQKVLCRRPLMWRSSELNSLFSRLDRKSARKRSLLFPIIPMFDNSRFPVNISGSMFDFTRTQT